MLTAYLFFHCNLAFSSIEEEQRPTVIDRCYSPMLDLAEKHGIPIGVEATGWTLEKIFRLRPEWIERLKRLLENRQCEFIGSGYAQIIGPLVPALVNAANQRLGVAVYERLLGLRPSLALVNEQAYSPGILEHYSDAGYSGVIMEWDNPRLAHPEWPAEYRYAPQKVRDMRGRKLDLIWNQSVVFQHLQRLAHDELTVGSYRDIVLRHVTSMPRALCIYGNDAEVFDFRPGRFETEAPMQGNEWAALCSALEKLRADGTVNYLLPGDIPGLNLPGAGHVLSLETPACPVPVKKQPKYNLLRWAVTGRDDTGINTRCHRLARHLAENEANEEDWRKLCFLWSSDFRTHITQKRWEIYLRDLEAFESKHGLVEPGCSTRSTARSGEVKPSHPRLQRQDNRVDLNTDTASIRLNTQKGLAVESALFPGVCPLPLFGTLPHGFFDTIDHAADFYTGHVVMEVPGQRRFTDLAPVTPELCREPRSIRATAVIPGFYCPLEKEVSVSHTEAQVSIQYYFSWEQMPSGSVRLLHLTLNPDAFDPASLYFATHNGGSHLERHSLDRPCHHGASVSFMISAAHGVGMTQGLFIFGDKSKELHIMTDPAQCAVVGMATHEIISGRHYTRLALSCREFDDTAKPMAEARHQSVTVQISAFTSVS